MGSICLGGGVRIKGLTKGGGVGVRRGWGVGLRFHMQDRRG